MAEQQVQQQEINIKELNVIQLKALAYDEVGRLNVAQDNLRMINQELFKRQQQNVEGAAPVTSKN